MKLALGTAQFGMDYGISNNLGQVSQGEIATILSYAKDHGIDTLDCAPVYGQSEEILGNIAESQSFSIVSKIPALAENEISIMPSFEQTLTALKRKTIDTLLFHDANTLLSHPNSALFAKEICQLKQQNLVNRIGISVYNPEQVTAAIEQLNIDIIQAPVNLIDQRFLQQEMQFLLNKHGIALHTRSAFLQGLLLMDEDKLPAQFSAHQSLFSTITQQANRLKVSKLALALAFLQQAINHQSQNQSATVNCIEKIVVGCCSTKQLLEIVDAYNIYQETDFSTVNWHAFSRSDTKLINPSYWQ